MADVSLIIVNSNGRQFLDDLCASLARQTCPVDEVIVVDNASTDGSVAHLRELYPWVTTIALAENVGYAQGNNIGAARATGRYLALLNNDTVADEHWLAELLAALEARPRAGAEFNTLGYCWGRGANQFDRGPFAVRGEVPALTACALLLRRDVLGDDPLFDPRLFMYYEEFDLSLRVRGAGYEIVYVPTAIVHHKRSQAVRGVTNRPLLFQQFLGNGNRLKPLLKYYPLPTLLRNLPLIGLSLAYWDRVFLREGGLCYCLRDLGAQGVFAWQGLRERRRRRARSEGWLPWMTRQGLRDILALRSSFAGGGA